MKVVRLDIKNFRGIRAATLFFNDHTLIVGPNNVGKSTICEALELVLGVDRLKRFPPVEEFDFYNANYLDRSLEPPQSIPIEVEVVLTGLSDELALLCVGQTESWSLKNQSLLDLGEAGMVDDEEVVECLRIRAIAYYDHEEDEFKARLVFCSGPTKDVPRNVRQLFGFIYLRALRTGNRALSLERGSLLDIILQRNNIRTGIWESTIDRLRSLNPPIDEGAVNLAPILENIEERLANYVAMDGDGRATQLFVSQLTREHLRKTISFFLKVDQEQAPVPFQDVGTGTLNALVLSLLSFIAEMKTGSVIFAMEEPEIAVSPHTQRRIAQYLISSADQCFVTSHSPYVIEQFDPEQIRILRRGAEGSISAKGLRVGETVKSKTYRRHARRAFSEAILARGVIVGEGITEKDILLATAAKLEEREPGTHYPLDLAGVSVISVDGEGSLAEFGEFFADLGISTYALFDSKPLKPDMAARVANAYVSACQTKYKGAEQLLVEECPVHRLWELLVEVRDGPDKPAIIVPTTKPSDIEIKKLAGSLLANNKGDGYAGRLIELCEVQDLPTTVRGLLEKVYESFKRPKPITPAANVTGLLAATSAPKDSVNPAGVSPPKPSVASPPVVPAWPPKPQAPPPPAPVTPSWPPAATKPVAVAPVTAPPIPLSSTPQPPSTPPSPVAGPPWLVPETSSPLTPSPPLPAPVAPTWPPVSTTAVSPIPGAISVPPIPPPVLTPSYPTPPPPAASPPWLEPEASLQPPQPPAPPSKPGSGT